MIRFARLAAGAATAFAVVVCLTMQAGARDDKEVAAAQAAVLKMTDSLGNTKVAEGFAKANSVESIMHQFKPRAKGGIGIGAAAPAPPVKDSIELTIIDLAADKKGFAATAFKQLGPDLVKMAKQTQAIAEINAFYAPTVKKGDKDPAKWKEFNDVMKAGAAELAKATDGPSAKAAAGKVNASCVNCHQIFRD